MDARIKEVLNRRHHLPLTTGVTNYVELTHSNDEYFLACYENQTDIQYKYLPQLKDATLVNNTTELGPCLFLICTNGEFEFQTDGKTLFTFWSSVFITCGIPLLTFNELYKLGECIGEGSFAKVYVGEPQYNDEPVVVKAVDKSKVKDSNVYTEIQILRKVSHEYIIRLWAAYEQEQTINLVLEYLRGGELFDWLSEHGQYHEGTAKQGIKRILLALQSMHSQGVVHRDLKTENLILEQKGNPVSLKIIDFGLASTLGSPTMRMRCGSPGYVAPEILEDHPYGTKVDIFSAGVILFTMLGGYPPFRGAHAKEILKKNLQCRIVFNSARWANVSQQAMDLVLWMTNRDPERRCSAVQALTHPWFEKVIAPPVDTTRPIATSQMTGQQTPTRYTQDTALTSPSATSYGGSVASTQATQTRQSVDRVSPAQAKKIAAGVRAVQKPSQPFVKPSPTSARGAVSPSRAPAVLPQSGRESPARTYVTAPIDNWKTKTDRAQHVKEPPLALPSAAFSTKPVVPVREKGGPRVTFNPQPSPQSEGSPLSTPHYIRTKRRAKTNVPHKETSQLVQSNAYSSKSARPTESKGFAAVVSPTDRKQSAASVLSAAPISHLKRSRTLLSCLERMVGLDSNYRERMATSGFIGIDGAWTHAVQTVFGNEVEAALFDKQIEELTASVPYLPSIEQFRYDRRGEGKWRNTRPEAAADMDWSSSAKLNQMIVTSTYFRACRFGPSRASVCSSRMSILSKMSLVSAASSSHSPTRKRGASLYVYDQAEAATVLESRKSSKTVRFARTPSTGVVDSTPSPRGTSLVRERRRVQSLPNNSRKAKMAADEATLEAAAEKPVKYAAGTPDSTSAAGQSTPTSSPTPASPTKKRHGFGWYRDQTTEPSKPKTMPSPPDPSSPLPSLLSRITGVARLRHTTKQAKATDKEASVTRQRRVSMFKR